ncbi:MAG TPA: GyrI-like domain-containing protein [Candidatus Sulfotelmatobacter sp.]|nr:GyrI-like domain-containing protein [Candidatus Sulfotelmatobacter sp.]
MRIALAVSFVLFALALLAAQAPGVKVAHRSGFSVIGIEVRTSNRKELSGDGVIGKQWEKFFQDDVLGKIPNKTGSNIYAVYSDYASDRNGEYSFLIGAKVDDGSIAAPGFVLKTVPSGRYAEVTSEAGPIPKNVVEAWQRVWQMEDKHTLGGARAYKVDYEVYDQRAADPQNSQVDLYIGLK